MTQIRLKTALRFGCALLAGAALGAPAFAAAGQGGGQSGGITGPTSAQLLKSATQSSNWLLPAGNYQDNRMVREHRITPDNVKDMQVAWTFDMPKAGVIESSPVVYDGMIYVTTSQDTVYALNEKTGQEVWKYVPHPTQLAGNPRNRGVAVYDGLVFVAMINGHVAALDAKTGKVAWNKKLVADRKTGSYTMQPVVYKGRLLLGVCNGDWGGIGNISAFDPKTGKQLWQWQSIPGPGRKGHDSWSGDSWKRGGGAIWMGVGAIDPKTDTLYISTGNPQPDFLGKNRKGKNLYTDSIVALNISGAKPKMEWYYQFTPHDTHDWDPAMPPVLFQGTIGGQQQELVADGDKAGNFWILNAKTGKLVSKTPLSYQLNQDTHPPVQGTNFACPNTNGGIEFNGGAYDPATNAFYVPSSNQCGKWSAKKEAKFRPGEFFVGGSFPSLVGPSSGWFNAVNVANGVPEWRQHLTLPANGGALVMVVTPAQGSGGQSNSKPESLVFTGRTDGVFDAYDAATGKQLWHYQTGASITAPSVTYTLDGKRYVTIASGSPGYVKTPKERANTAPSHLTAFVMPAGGQGSSS